MNTKNKKGEANENMNKSMNKNYNDIWKNERKKKKKGKKISVWLHFGALGDSTWPRRLQDGALLAPQGVFTAERRSYHEEFPHYSN